MNWDAIGAAGEVLGAIVVAITLIYLTIQTKQNRKAMEASGVTSVLQSFSKVHQAIIQSEEVALLHEKGLRDPSSLTKGESLRFFMLVREAMNTYSSLFGQYQSGIVDERTWKSMSLNIYVSQPGVRKFIADQQHAWEPEFVEHINSLEQYTTSDPVTFMAGSVADDT